MSQAAPTQTSPFEDVRVQFFHSGDGLTAVKSQTAATDAVVSECYERHFTGPSGARAALIAVGGYGRAQLFPCSDVDLLFLFQKDRQAKESKDQIATALTELWDAGLQVSQSVRTPAECSRLATDNAELHISLLDTRFLAGDRALFEDLRNRLLPRFYEREQKTLLKNLIEMAQARHQSFGRTIYHLEPNLKEAPGGLRDIQVSCWLSQLSNVTPTSVPKSEECLPDDALPPLLAAKKYLFELRCRLHYANGRDNNKLTFDLQDVIADEEARQRGGPLQEPANWMRDYYRQARVIHRLALRMIDQATPRQSLFTFMRDRKSRLSTGEFAVSRGRIFLRDSRILEGDPAAVLRLFAHAAKHGLPPALETEKRITAALPTIREWGEMGGHLWEPLAAILNQPHAYHALAEMHETGVLSALLPEFEGVDSLVIRDFYHRYTVDEHTFVTIDILHRLPQEEDPLVRRFARLFTELDRPEQLYGALLLHDIGKAVPGGSHEEHSCRLAARAMDRLGVDEEDRRMIDFLIERHLEMSQFMRTRDLNEPDSVAELATSIGTVERLKALTLMTYADISGVSPSAMTAWRRDLLWQVYVAVNQFLTQEVEDQRIHVESTEPYLKVAPTASDKKMLAAFLEGLPKRYLRTHTPKHVWQHFELARKLEPERAGVRIEKRHSLYEAVVIGQDRPFLFASLCAGFSRFGLNIQKVEAFGNNQGLVLDTFVVADPGRALDLNPDELGQLKKTLRRVAEGRLDAAELLSARRETFSPRPRVEPHVAFDNQTSTRSTIFHVIAGDRSGLLFDLASKFSQHEGNIEVVLIDTQGNKALDTFYVVGPAGKLPEPVCETLRDELTAVCCKG